MTKFTMEHSPNQFEKRFVRKNGFLTLYAFRLGHIEEWNSVERFNMQISEDTTINTPIINARIVLLKNNKFHVFIRNHQDKKILLCKYDLDKNKAYELIKKEIENIS